MLILGQKEVDEKYFLNDDNMFVRELFYNFDAITINTKTFPKSIKKITLKKEIMLLLFMVRVMQ